MSDLRMIPTWSLRCHATDCPATCPGYESDGTTMERLPLQADVDSWMMGEGTHRGEYWCPRHWARDTTGFPRDPHGNVVRRVAFDPTGEDIDGIVDAWAQATTRMICEGDGSDWDHDLWRRLTGPELAGHRFTAITGDGTVMRGTLAPLRTLHASYGLGIEPLGLTILSTKDPRRPKLLPPFEHCWIKTTKEGNEP